jgi:hypothetical protein
MNKQVIFATLLEHDYKFIVLIISSFSNFLLFICCAKKNCIFFLSKLPISVVLHFSHSLTMYTQKRYSVPELSVPQSKNHSRNNLGRELTIDRQKANQTRTLRSRLKRIEPTNVGQAHIRTGCAATYGVPTRSVESIPQHCTASLHSASTKRYSSQIKKLNTIGDSSYLIENSKKRPVFAKVQKSLRMRHVAHCGVRLATIGVS